MDFLCFTIKENKIAIRILDVYVLIDKTETTHFPNQEGKSMYLINYFDELIPVFVVNNDLIVNNKRLDRQGFSKNVLDCLLKLYHLHVEEYGMMTSVKQDSWELNRLR